MMQSPNPARPVAPFRLSMTASRLLSVALLLAAFSQLGCRRRLRRGLRFRAVGLPARQSAQDALEAARGGKLDGTLCQGRLDLLDLRFELADRSLPPAAPGAPMNR